MSPIGYSNRVSDPTARQWLIGGGLTMLQLGIVGALTMTWAAASEAAHPTLGLVFLVFPASFGFGCGFAIPPVATGMLIAVTLFRFWRITYAPIYAGGGVLIGVGWVFVCLKAFGNFPTPNSPIYTALIWGAAVGLLAGLFLWQYLWKLSNKRQGQDP